MAKQAIKKGAIKKPSLQSFKENKGLTGKNMKVSNANKPQSWIIMPEAFRDVTKLPGIPENTVISIIGHTNVGKSTLINHAITSAQQMGAIPVIYDTENSFSFQYATTMGFQAEPVYGDVEVEVYDSETGEYKTETRTEIVEWTGDFLYFNNRILCELYGDINYSTGKRESKKRTVAVVEDVATSINELLDEQENGNLPHNLLIAWDSVGSIGCLTPY